MPQKFRVMKGDTILISAHTGDSFPVSEQPLDPARLTAIPAIDPLSWRMMNKGTHSIVKVEREGGLYYSLFTKAKFLEMEPAKFEEYLTNEGLSAQLAIRKQASESGAGSREMYSKFAKTYVVSGKPDDAFKKPVGLKIEIVPLAEPSSLKAGDSLPILVLYDGKPLPAAQVEIAVSEKPAMKGSIKIAGKTDSSGKLMVPISGAGRIRLHTIAMERVKQPTHDWESFWASLTFEVSSESSNLTGK